MPRTTRRATLTLAPSVLLAGGGGLGLPLLLAGGCATREAAAPEPPPGPLSYTYLTALPLQVAALEIAEGDPPSSPGDIGASLSPRPAEAVRIMARDRLSAVGTAGRVVFSVTQASLVRLGGGALSCLLGCRLEILGADGAVQGFAEAAARAGVSGAEAERPQAADRLLRRAMDALNVEFEFQLRRNLRPWLVNVAPGSQGALPAPSPPADDIAREDLPRS